MTAPLPSETDILIVGAGPTGLLLANLLGGMGVRTTIVERNRTTVQQPRAVSIDDESLRALQAAGLSGEVARITTRGYGSIYRGPDGRVFATVKPWVKEYGFDKRNAFQQPELEALMRDGLSRHSSVTAVFGVEVTGFRQDAQAVVAEVAADEGLRQIRARYMVACDGGRSPTRKALGIEMEGSTFREPWLIVDLHSTLNRCFHTEVFCDPARSCITLPGPGGIRRYEFKLNTGETAEIAEQEAFARRLLAQVGPDAEQPLRRIQVYTFHARNAASWRSGRVFLAGDAAHLTPPFAGQGMNSGLRDAHNLAWKLDEALRSEDPERLLASYQNERKPHAWEMIELARRMGQVMMPRSALAGAAIRAGFRALNLYPPARDYFVQMKYKPKPRFRDGLLWQGAPGWKAQVVGRMIPQPLVDTVARARVRLDTLLPDQPAVLVYSETPETALPAPLCDELRAAGAALIGVTPEGCNPVPGPFPTVRDHDGFLSAPGFGAAPDHVFLLRRDRYIAACVPVAEAASLRQMLQVIAPGRAAAA
ncbi:bifunctional 3-(3-hydroxy-phenyl)propionate/3-hydroxycinnamic acid hydroxylase [Frigidibacter oleivorans]|uniref:bifunctional 3-(3-hydroxy-phenyl)propionate/3-hydroxycinnamic acid hydroxylase n=1 Tax=Frigidibacter oleivorans TaxID=2487129 RepID=UPI000F8ED525|nr:bifunctional 3-(3-hydroxy-phenyl)propionate/3-hydroxycinnamic acid hydroxylase [Frigidibacter oleivorans]